MHADFSQRFKNNHLENHTDERTSRICGLNGEIEVNEIMN